MKGYVNDFSWRRIFAIVAVGMLVGSCSDNAPAPKPEEEFLIDATLVYSATSAQIKLLAAFSGLGLDVNEFQYDVDIFSITYHSTYKGAGIEASGLVILPKTTQPVGMLSFQHGTIVLHDDAPSNFSASDPNALLYGAVSSSGFIGVIPDYLGFGASSDILHPYYIEVYAASAVVDMLKAARELAEEKKVQFNGRLFLAGYSEGGYATMAAHKAIEAAPVEGFELIASFAAAGGYDITGMQSYLLGLTTYDEPYYLAYLARAYQLTYDFNALLTDFFKDPYAGKIPSLFNGLQDAPEINAQLTDNLPDLVQDNLASDLNTNAQYAYIVDALEENSLTDWKPEKKLFLYHGNADITIPPQNSQDTYDRLISNGASTDIVSLISLEGTHSTAVTPYLLDFVPKLWALR